MKHFHVHDLLCVVETEMDRNGQANTPFAHGNCLFIKDWESDLALLALGPGFIQQSPTPQTCFLAPLFPGLMIRRTAEAGGVLTEHLLIARHSSELEVPPIFTLILTTLLCDEETEATEVK